MGTFLVQVWDGSRARWQSIGLFYALSAAEECGRSYLNKGYTVRIV